MKKGILLTLFYLFFSGFAHSQDFQGKAVYMSKTSVDMDFGGREMSEEQKKRIQERMKSAFEKTYILTFDRTAATYLEEEKLETPNAGGGGFRMMAMGGSGKYYKNIKDQTYTDQKEMFGKIFLIKDSLPKLEWKMGSETKQIGNYTCYKATATRAIDSTDFSRFRRPPPPGERGGNSNEPKNEEVKKDSTDKKESLFKAIEIPKEIEITAWYTLDIPIGQGPGEYWGLPGLILEVNAGRTSILCSKIILNAEEKVVIEAPSKGKEVDQKEYNAIQMEKMKEMSERFRGGNRGGGGSEIRIRN